MAEESITAVGAESAEVQANRELIQNARQKGRGSLPGTFVKLSGPGWLQSAITLGGGSLASSLYLGVLAGTSLLWLQPFAMVVGVIMLSAISYVALSTSKRPFRAINEHVSPVLGWGWLLATLMANLVWALPQFSLATAAVRQNLMPGVFGGLSDTAGKVVVCLGIAIVCTVVTTFYDSGRKGVKICDIILKAMVGVIILSFFGVVIKLSFSSGGLPWGKILSGLVPDLRLLNAPAQSVAQHISAVADAYQGYWTDIVVKQQRGVLIAAAATAVGINMTFLLPYSMLRRGWDRDFRGMAIFDLATGLFIPFIFVTGLVVIVAAHQFHTKPAPGFLGEKTADGALVAPEKKLVGQYQRLAKGRVKAEVGKEAFAALSPEQVAARVDSLPEADRRLAAMLVKRDAFSLANSLAPLTGRVYAHYVFGTGVVGMAVSSIIILMLINGFVICEMFDLPSRGWPYRIGCLLPLVGILGPFLWTGGKAQFWLAVPTSNIAFVLLPIAYLSFAFLLNSKSLLGDAMPSGGARIVWNLLAFPAAGLAAVGSVWKLWTGLGWLGIGLLAVVLVLCAIVHGKSQAASSSASAEPAEEAGGDAE